MHYAYLISLSVSLVGGIAVIYYGLDNQGGLWFPVIFLVTRFGATSAFCLIVVGNSSVFDVSSAAKALSIPMFMARAAMGISPLISALE